MFFLIYIYATGTHTHTHTHRVNSAHEVSVKDCICASRHRSFKIYVCVSIKGWRVEVKGGKMSVTAL